LILINKTYFECVIPERNKRAFYEIVAGRDLFGFIVFRRWGRIGTKGHPKMQQRFTNETEMRMEYSRVCSERIKHGYKLRHGHTNTSILKTLKIVYARTKSSSNHAQQRN